MSEVLDIASMNLPQLPHGWHYRAVSEIGAAGEQAVLTGPFGTNLGRGDFVASGVPLLTIGCLTQGGISLDKALFVSDEKAQELSRYRLKEGDLLFSRMASVGRAGLVPKWLEGALFNYHIMRLRLDDAHIDARLFINYVRGAKQVRSYLKAVNHGATRDGINTEQLLGLPVAVPPIAEQREIVAEIEKQFSRLDEAVANLQRVKANLKRYKAAVLKAAVEGRLVETEAELARREGRSYESGELLLQRILVASGTSASASESQLTPAPEGWAWASSDAVFDFVTSGSRGWAKYYATSGARFLRVGNLDHGTIDLDLNEIQHVTPPQGPEAERSRVAPGDLLISITAELGMVALVPANIGEAYVNQHVAIARTTAPIDKAFLAWFFASEHGGKRQLEALRKGATKAGLGLDDIRSVAIALPPLSEQQRIVAEIDRRLSIVREVEAEVDANLKRARALRQATLTKAFGVD